MMRQQNLSVTQERINALRIIQNKSFEDMSVALNEPVYRIKLWCGYRLSFAEWLTWKRNRILTLLYFKGGGVMCARTVETN